MNDVVSADLLDVSAFDTPRILLAGAVDYDMYDRFRDRVAQALGQRPGGQSPKVSTVRLPLV